MLLTVLLNGLGIGIGLTGWTPEAIRNQETFYQTCQVTSKVTYSVFCCSGIKERKKRPDFLIIGCKVTGKF